MTTTTTTAATLSAVPPIETRQDQPAVVPLPEGRRACIDCGLAVADNGSHPSVEIETVAPWKGVRDALRTTVAKGVQGRAVVVRFSRCDDCGRRERIVRAALSRGTDGNDGTTATVIDVPESEVHKLRSALHVVAVLNQQMPDIVGDRRILRLLVRHLFQVGVGLRWVSRFLPAIEPGADPATCASTSWAHVTGEQRDAARHAFGAFLAGLIAAPVTVPCPTPPPPCDDLTGCLFCGVRAISFTSDQPRRWKPVTVTTPGVIGAPPMSGQPVWSYLCVECSQATEEVGGAIGIAAAERAYRQHLAATGTPADKATLQKVAGVDLPAAICWAGAVLRARRAGRPVPPPNTSRWGHLAVE